VKSRQEKGKAANDLSKCIEDLTGQKTPIECPEALATAVNLLDGKKSAGLGLSQLNELLLQLGYDRVSPMLFMYLCDGTIQYEAGRSIASLAQLRQGVDRFRRLALLFYGNVKFGFKRLALSEEDLADHHARSAPKSKEPYKRRHPSILELKQISGEETFYLGYVVQRNLEQRLKDHPNDGQAKAMLKRRAEIVKTGRFNHEVYLCSDHMDVYVATSMREKHEYAMVHEWTKEIFASTQLKALNVRWFDPTQAYCADRIDKGLAEALMLKRAQCTLYFAQESDTLGKDSELASTLAQGKPVIAYVPEGGDEYVNDLVGVLKRLNPGEGEVDLLLEQLRVFEPPPLGRMLKSGVGCLTGAGSSRRSCSLASVARQRTTTTAAPRFCGTYIRLGFRFTWIPA